MVARLLWEQDAAGSNPVSPTRLIFSQRLSFLPPAQGGFLLFISRVPSWCPGRYEPPHGNSSYQLICLGSVSRQSGNRPTERYAHREWWRQLFPFSKSTSRQLRRRPQTVSNACDHKAERIQDHPTAPRNWWDSFKASVESTTPA